MRPPGVVSCKGEIVLDAYKSVRRLRLTVRRELIGLGEIHFFGVIPTLVHPRLGRAQVSRGA